MTKTVKAKYAWGSLKAGQEYTVVNETPRRFEVAEDRGTHYLKGRFEGYPDAGDETDIGGPLDPTKPARDAAQNPEPYAHPIGSPQWRADLEAASKADPDPLKEIPRHEIEMPPGTWDLVVEHIRKFLPADQADKPMTPMDVIAYISQLRNAAKTTGDTLVEYQTRANNLAEGSVKLMEENSQLNTQLRAMHGVVRELATEVRVLSAIVRGAFDVEK